MISIPFFILFILFCFFVFSPGVFPSGVFVLWFSELAGGHVVIYVICFFFFFWILGTHLQACFSMYHLICGVGGWTLFVQGKCYRKKQLVIRCGIMYLTLGHLEPNKILVMTFQLLTILPARASLVV